MKFNVQLDEKCEQTCHKSISGKAFAYDSKSKLILFGGQNATALVSLNDINAIIKKKELKTSLFKWFISNYEWDPLNTSNGSERYLQTKNKIIEIVNLETLDTLVTLSGHGRIVNEAKWSPFKRNYIASTSIDSNIFIWNTDSPKPAILIPSVGEVDCLAWNKSKENILAVSSNNDIRIYDIRKTNSAFRYISNAHSKKIYSLDWCSTEEILVSSSRDRNIKLWNINGLNQKFMEKILEDPDWNWKAKFTPYGLCFGVIPTCLSNPYQYINQTMSPNSKYINTKSNFNDSNNQNDIKDDEEFNTNQNNDINVSSDNNNNSNNVNSNINTSNINNSENNHNNSNNNFDTRQNSSLVICQITSLDETRIYKFSTNQTDMILNFDFDTQNDKFNVISWTKDQCICVQSLDLCQIVPKELERSSSAQTSLKQKEDDELVINTQMSKQLPNSQSSLISQQSQFQNSNIQIPNTTNSSRKSSISEYCYGTPPANINSFLSGRTLVNERESINLADDNTINELVKVTSNSLSLSSNPQYSLRSSSAVFLPGDFLKRYPRSFGARFSGLPEQFVIFQNEGVNQVIKTNQREFENLANKRFRSQSKSKSNKSQLHHGKQLAKRIQIAKVYIYDISNLVNMRRDFAEKYHIVDNNLEKICEQNISICAQLKRFDIVKIWELLKFITMSVYETASINPDYGRPWSCSTFGRPLVNNLIDSCIKLNDIQSAAMIISKIKRYDMNINSIVCLEDNKYHSKKPKLESPTQFHLNDPDENIKNFNENDSEKKKHMENLSLLDPNRLNEFDNFIKFYCEILYRWGLYNKRVEMLEFVNNKPKDFDEKFECFKRCNKCFNLTTNSKCNSCKSYLIHCSICELPVNGLSTYCAICGHGGHYDHLIEWFKRHDDCPSACGCRCVDYL